MSERSARQTNAGLSRYSMAPTPAEPRWESVANAAKIYRVAPKTIREHIQAGDFVAVFFGRVLRVDLNSIDAWLRPVSVGRP